MNEKITAVVVIAYNRPKSLTRLLQSLGDARYPDVNIPLIISVDFAEKNQEVLRIVENFNWKFGTREIIKHKKNLGLRKHVLKCGDLSANYDAIIMLEDDLFVSPNFYTYATQALNFSEDKAYLAGISLYNHPLNVHTNEIFKPLDDGYDNYYFQFASSWGQAWTREQWRKFKLWYVENQKIVPDAQIPKNVTDWTDKSWLKYFTVYLINTNKYFLYPKISLSTNFSDTGTHAESDSTSYQAYLNFAHSNTSLFSRIEESNSIYDAFYENMRLHESLGLDNNELCVDLYGYKNDFTSKFCLSTQLLNYKIIKSFGRSLKPIDANIIANINGSDIFLYDTSTNQVNNKLPNNYRRISYNIGHLSFRNSLLVTGKLLALKIKATFDFIKN